MEKSEKKILTTVRLPEELYKKIKEVAVKKDRSITYILKECIKKGMKDY